MRVVPLLVGLIAAVTSGADLDVVRRELPEMPSVSLRSSGKLDMGLVPECSALWASPSIPGVFWTLSDSGNKPMIVPIHADGSLVLTPKGYWKGVTL